MAREKGCKGTLRDPVRKPLTEGQASKAAPPRVVVPTRLDASTLSKLQSQVGISHPVAFNEAVQVTTKCATLTVCVSTTMSESERGTKNAATKLRSKIETVYRIRANLVDHAQSGVNVKPCMNCSRLSFSGSVAEGKRRRKIAFRRSDISQY